MPGIIILSIKEELPTTKFGTAYFRQGRFLSRHPNANTVSRENAIPYIGKKKPGLSKQFGLSLKKTEPET